MKKLLPVLAIFFLSGCVSGEQTKFTNCSEQLSTETKRADRNAVLIWVSVFCLVSTHIARTIFKDEQVMKIE